MKQVTFYKLVSVFFILCFLVSMWVMNSQQQTISEYSALCDQHYEDMNEVTVMWQSMYSTMSQKEYQARQELSVLQEQYDQLLKRSTTQEADLSAMRLNEERYKTSLGLMTEPAVVLSHEDLVILAKTVQLEAGPSVNTRGEPINTTGQKYITRVILNRVVSPTFPNTVKEVVYQKNQFSVVGSLDSEVVEPGTLLNIYDVLLHNGAGDLPSYVCYFYADYVKDQWINTLPVYMTIDGTVYAYDAREMT